MQHYSLRLIDARHTGVRLDKYVMQHMRLPWSAAHKLIRSKHVCVLRPDSTVVAHDIAYKLQHGDTLSVKDAALDWADKPTAY